MFVILTFEMGWENFKLRAVGIKTSEASAKTLVSCFTKLPMNVKNPPKDHSPLFATEGTGAD